MRVIMRHFAINRVNFYILSLYTMETRREYYFKHHIMLEDIYQALRPTNTLHKVYIDCPCGTKGVAYLKMKQHICSKKHRKVFPLPFVSDFV